MNSVVIAKMDATANEVPARSPLVMPCPHLPTWSTVHPVVVPFFDHGGCCCVVVSCWRVPPQVDHPEVNVQGFPTILFFPAGEKHAVSYDGSRDLDGFVDFLKDNAKVPFTLEGDDEDTDL